MFNACERPDSVEESSQIICIQQNANFAVCIHGTFIDLVQINDSISCKYCKLWNEMRQNILTWIALMAYHWYNTCRLKRSNWQMAIIAILLQNCQSLSQNESWPYTFSRFSRQRNFYIPKISQKQELDHYSLLEAIVLVYW